MLQDLLFQVERTLHAEFEFNPLSAASRAARAERRARYGQALRCYASDAHGDRVAAERFERALPSWPVAQLLVQAASELVLLERGATIARRAGVPEGLTSPIARQTEGLAEIIWTRARRLAAGASQRVEAARLQDGLQRQTQRLEGMLRTIQPLRHQLAAVTISGTPETVDRNEEQRLLDHLQVLGQVARELRGNADGQPDTETTDGNLD